MIVCYPGTFDPITNGHLDIIERAANMFEEVVVLIMKNPNKVPTFTEEERKELIEACLKDKQLNNVRVEIGSGLTVLYARMLGAKAIIRGIRAVTDYENELQQATANLTLADDVETLFFIAKPEYSFLSSSIVKEIAHNGGELDAFVPEVIIDKVKNKLKNS